MRGSLRAALTAASFLCVTGVATVSAPSLAAEVAGPAGSATAMLAVVTAPLIAGDLDRFRTANAAFSQQPAAEQAAPDTLEALVASNSDGDTANDDERCLATSIYYESKGEPLTGQLAVAQTILNRVESGRFAESVCGVVKQPGQFSFVAHGDMPTPPKSGAWSRAVAIARIASDGLWKQVAPAALFFHARRVAPGWGKTRIASVGNHVFFR